PLRPPPTLPRHPLPPLHQLPTPPAPPITFRVTPLFPFANAGLLLPHPPPQQWLLNPVVLGVALGLVVGKTLGIFGFAWLTVRLGLARYPTGMTPTHLLGVAITSGIGLTVAMFVANLPFGDRDATDIAKPGTLPGSPI